MTPARPPSRPKRKTQEERSPERSSERSKDELFWQVLDAALRLDCTRGHQRWKMTDLSRASGVTRSLIYYYFGNSKLSILRSAIQVIGEEFFGLSEKRQELWRRGEIWESVRLTRELVRNMPYTPIFYLTQRRPEGAFHAEIQELEKRYIGKLAAEFPQVQPERLQAIYAAFFGLVMVPELSDEALRASVEKILLVVRPPKPCEGA